MKDCKHDNPRIFVEKEDFVRKSPREGLADVSMDNGVLPGIASNGVQDSIYRQKKI